jgi:colicin import membrane protein
MKSGFIIFLLVVLPTGLHAQDDAMRSLEQRETEQREQITRMRLAYAVQFKAQEIACYQRFSVNDCLLENRRTQRDAIADLLRQEIQINDTQRKRRAAQQLLRTDEKLSVPAR